MKPRFRFILTAKVVISYQNEVKNNNKNASKIGMNHYEATMTASVEPWVLPFFANFFRCVAGFQLVSIDAIYW